MVLHNVIVNMTLRIEFIVFIILGYLQLDIENMVR
jgi:hypothetical protein